MNNVQALKPSYADIDSIELVQFLLKETDQLNDSPANVDDLLIYLDLKSVKFNFKLTAHSLRLQIDTPKALLSFKDRVVAVDSELIGPSARFGAIHEIAHYVLPNHTSVLFLCDSSDMSVNTQLILEREANQFTADLLFKAGLFEIEANSFPVNAQTVKVLAQKYCVSFEATSHRIADKSIKPCMLVVFEPAEQAGPNVFGYPETWSVKYCVPSQSFKTTYFVQVTGSISGTIPQALSQTKDIAESISDIAKIGSVEFNAEYYFNKHNIFCFLTEKS